MTLYRTFFVPHSGGEAAQEAMDAFIRGHRTLAVERAVFPNGWAFCVEWMEGTGPAGSLPAAGFRGGGKVDYREVLEPAAFDRFVRLRKARMEIAETDGVTPFVVMTDTQMAQLAKTERPTKADLGRIEGFGEARVAKYAERLLAAVGTEARLPGFAAGDRPRERGREAGRRDGAHRRRGHVASRSAGGRAARMGCGERGFEPNRKGMEMNTKRMARWSVAVAAVWALAAGAAWAGDGFGSARSGAFRLDLREGTRIAGGGAERVVVSGRWEGSAAVARADGAVLATAEAGEEKVVEWVPAGTGLHVLRHESGGTALEAAFTVLGDDVVLHAGAIAGSETWAAGKVHLVTAPVTVGSGAALAIESGAVVKFMDGTGLEVASGGSCTAYGVVFTHAADDSVGGDTLMDGAATAPAMGAYSLSGNILEDEATEERYAAPVVLGGTLSYDVRLHGHRVYTAVGNITIASGVTVTIAPGAIIKMGSGLSVTVASGATLVAQGTRAEPIVCTSAKDDEHGGDTNGDGDATSPQPGDWYQIRVLGTAIMDHCSVLYASSGENYGGVEAYGGTVTFDNGEIAFMKYDSVNAHSSGTFTARNSVIREGSLGFGYYGSGRVKAFNCVFHGLTTAVRQSGKELVNCVLSECQSFTDQGGDGSTFRNCVFWNPPGYGAQSYSKVGSNGNKWGDPLFVDAANGDFRIAATSPCVDAGDTAAAPERDAWGQPRMDVKAVADTGVPNADGVCADIGIYEVPGTVTGPMADVAVLSVSVPASARVGEEIAVAYVVTNRGTAVAAGTVRDAVRLRGADEATAGMSVDAVEAVQAYSLEPGASARMTARVRVPAVAAGAWQVGVEANPARDFFEANLANNRAWSAGTLEVRLDALEAGTREVTVAGGAVAGYELAGLPESGGVVRVSGAGAAALAVLAGNGAMPTADGGGVAAVALPDGDWLAVLPAREAGEAAYLSLANGSGASVSAEVTVSGAATALLAVSPSRIPNAGEASLTLYGRGLDAAASSLGGRKAASVERIDGARVLATFDVDGAAAGAVDVSAAGAVLAGAVEIYAVKEGPKLEAWLETPGSIRDGRVFTAHVCYRNAGDAAMPLPLFKVSRLDSTTKLGMAAGEMPSETALYVGGVAPSAPVGVLKPGEEGRVPFFFQPFGSYRLSLAHMGDSEVAGAFPGFGGVAGYREAVAAAATRLALRGAAVADLHALVAQALLERNGQPCAALSGRLVDAAARTPLADVSISAIPLDADAVEDATSALAVTDPSGHFSLGGLADGDYRFVLEPGTALAAESTNAVTLAGQLDVNGLELYATPGGRLSGHVLDAEGNPVEACQVTCGDMDGNLKQQALTDAFGAYEMTNVPVGTWVVIAHSKNGWLGAAQTNVVVSEMLREAETDFALQLGGIISGVVSADGTPVTNGTVRASLETGETCETPVDGAGAFLFDGLPAASYVVEFYSAELESDAVPVAVGAGSTADLALEAKPRPLFFPLQSVGFGSLTTAFLFGDDERAAAATAWAWDFDSDGVVDSTEATPVWTFSAVGTYTVTLTLTEPSGTATSIYPDCVRVEERLDTILQDNAIVFGENSGSLVCTGMGEDTLQLTGSADLALAPGVVVMGRCGEDWFVRRITGVEGSAAGWTLQTENARLIDVYRQLGTAVAISVDEAQTRSPQLLANALLDAAHAKDPIAGGEAEIEGAISAGDWEFYAKTGINVNLDFTKDLRFEWIEQIKDGQEYSSFALVGSMGLRLSAEAYGAVGVNWSHTVPIPFKLVVPVGGPVPIILTPDFSVTYSANVQGKLSGEAHAQATLKLRIGGEMLDGKWKWFKPFDFEKDAGASWDLEGSGTFGVTFSPGIKARIAGISSLVVAPKLGLSFQFTASLHAPPSFETRFKTALHAEVNLVDLGSFFKLGIPIDINVSDSSLFKWTGPEPDFTYTPQQCLVAPATYNFLNNSKGDTIKFPYYTRTFEPTGYEWDLGNGVCSTAKNPSGYYPEEGSYAITLRAKGAFLTGPYRKKRTVNVGKPNEIPEDKEPEYKSDDNESGKSQQSWDPNEMRGPAGVGGDRLVERGQWMDYTVFFENHAGADVADAQEVTVELALDPALDRATFEAGEVAFGAYTDLGLEGLARGRTAIALTNGTGRSVKTTLEYDEETGKAKWYLRIVDSKGTFGWPEDGSGFLPPNDPATHCGEGYLTYRAKVRDDAADGARIDAAATIVFDYNAPIATDPAWWNKVGVPPETVQVALGEDDWMDVVIGQPYGDALPVPTRLGWEFGGWFTGPDGTGKQVTAETLASADTLELFAKWTRAVFGELWLDVTHGSVVVGTNGVTAGFGPDGEAVEGIAERYVLTGTSSVHSVRFAGGSFTNTWTNLVIGLSAKDAEAVTLEGALVEVTLAGDNALASGEDCAGVRVDAASALVLQGEGRLVAQGGKCGAGIGGGKLQESGRMEIRAGTVEAYGGEYGAGIGGGLVAPAAEAVVITGGSVKARGSDGGEDIGGGFGREGTGAPVDAGGTEVHEVEVPLVTEELPVVVVVEWGDGRTYRYEGMGHEGDSSLWFWLPDGTYDFEADGEDYGAHVAGASAVAVFTDPGSGHFESPAVEEVSVAETGWRVGLNPAYRTTPFDLWTATTLEGAAWVWEKVLPEMYRFDAETGAVQWLGETKGVRVFRFSFRAKE